MKVAVVGLGYWGPNLVRALSAIEGCDEIVLCDSRESRLARVASRYPSATAVATLDTIVQDPSIDAVIAATPITSHFEIASAILAARKHVLVEKPLAASFAEASFLLAQGREAGCVVMAGHTFLHSPPVRVARELIAAGELGMPLFAQSSRMNLGVHQADVSVLWDLAPHDLSILTYWLDEQPTRVSAIGRSTQDVGRADVAFLNVEFPSGCIASIHLSWLAPTKVRRTTLVGSRKMIVYEDTNVEEPIKVYDKGIAMPDPEDFGAHHLTYRTGSVLSPHVEPVEPLKVELREFISRVRENRVDEPQDAAALAVVRTIEAAEMSLAAGGRPIEV